MKGALGNAMFSWKVTPFFCLLLFLWLGCASLGEAQDLPNSTVTTATISTLNVTGDEAVNEASAAPVDNTTLAPEISTANVTTHPEDANTTATPNITTTAPPPPPTTENTTTSSTTTTPSTTTASTTPTTPTQTTPVTTPNNTTPPPTTESSSTATKSTEPSVTTASLATKTPHTSDPGRRFDAPSFIGGIVLSVGLLAIVYVGYKFYRARTEHNYHTL